jgi:hypothetical protein
MEKKGNLIRKYTGLSARIFYAGFFCHCRRHHTLRPETMPSEANCDKR